MAKIPVNLNTHFDMNAMKERLLSTAIPYAESLKSRHNLVAIMLYGSLTHGTMTPFSDIDLALFYDSDPIYGIEHRMINGEKVDIISFTLDETKQRLNPVPSSLDAGFPFSYILEDLLLADDDSILYDPTGELLQIKTNLKEATSFQALNRVSLNEGYREFYKVNAEKAKSMYEQGDMTRALDKAKWCGEALARLLRSYTVMKDTREAAMQLGIIEFDDKRLELASIMAPSSELVEAVYSSTRTLWDYTMSSAAGLLEEYLHTHGVSDTDHLEMVGDYDLFWDGENLYEYGRLMQEVNLSLRWCRYDLDRGKGDFALRHLWACRGTQKIRYRWDRLAAALEDTGYNCQPIIEGMLNSAGFARLAEDLDSVMQAIECKDATPEVAEQALNLVEDMERILIQAIPVIDE